MVRVKNRKNYYFGRLNGNQIHVRMKDDPGNPAVEWILTKSNTSQ